MLSTTEVAKKLGVHANTIRKWDKEGKVKAARVASGHRRYNPFEIEKIVSSADRIERERSKIIYCRVSSTKQKGDLERQVEFMRKIYPDFRVIKDIGSGVNFRRPGLIKILELLHSESVQTIAVSYRDRLARVGYGLLAELAKVARCEIITVHDTSSNPEGDLVKDILAITTSYSARIHGLRKYANKKSDEVPRDSAPSEERDKENVERVDVFGESDV